jgi:YHS domain-containing protein
VPKGSLIPPGTAPEGTPGTKDFGPGIGGIKIDNRLPGGGLGGLEEPSEQPKTPLKPFGVEGGLPGLQGLPLTPGGVEKPKTGVKDIPAFEPPTAPKTNEEGSNRRPRGVRPVDPMLQRISPQPEEGKIRADWTRVLEPGFRGEADRPRLTQSSAPPARPQPNMGPVRQAAHQAADLPGRSAVQRPVFEQAAGQPNQVAPASWQPENRPAMLDGYCPVDLGKNERWSKGDPRWNATFQGMTFYFSSAMQRECFLVDLERYVPAYSGSDAVLLIEGNRAVPGKVDFCVSYAGRIYMFSSAESLAKFRQEPKRYTLTGR